MREKIENAVNAAKDAWVWSAGAIAAHPHRTMVLILGLVLIGLKSCV